MQLGVFASEEQVVASLLIGASDDVEKNDVNRNELSLAMWKRRALRHAELFGDNGRICCVTKMKMLMY